MVKASIVSHVTDQIRVTLLVNLLSQKYQGKIFDVKASPGRNYDKAEFRLWVPEKPEKLRGILVLIHGSNMDARPWVEASRWREMSNEVKMNTTEYFWQDLATRNGLGLLGCNFTDKPHEDMFIEEYCNVGLGSGQALLDALKELAKLSGHIEIAEAPLIFWGISAGGQYSYEFTCWRPDRVLCFVLNKGGIYYTALASKSARMVPGILFIGDEDSNFRNDIIKGVFALNRRAGARWALVVEPGAVHETGRSLEVSEVFFDEVIPLRLPGNSAQSLRLLELEDGFLGDLITFNYSVYNEEKSKVSPASWLISEGFARVWQACARKEVL
jgi:pimeloyl-ACP methyl ester carboxylesterase